LRYFLESTMRGTETVPHANNSEKGRLRDTRLTKYFGFFVTFLRIYGELFVANASHGFSGKSAIRLSRGHQPDNVLPSTLPSSTSANFFRAWLRRLLTI